MNKVTTKVFVEEPLATPGLLIILRKITNYEYDSLGFYRIYLIEGHVGTHYALECYKDTNKVSEADIPNRIRDNILKSYSPRAGQLQTIFWC